MEYITDALDLIRGLVDGHRGCTEDDMAWLISSCQRRLRTLHLYPLSSPDRLCL
jgi:hypothetical protein